jgi:hypothetical protein
VGQAKTTVDMFRVMDERKILLVKLSAQLDQVTSLIGSVIIALFLNAAYSRAALPVNKRKQFNLYADEFLSTPIDYLLSGKTHANPVVNMFINKWDVRKLVLDSSAINKNIIIDTLNKYGYQAMTGTNPDNLPVSLDILAYWVHIQNIGPFYEEFLFDSPPSYTTNHDNLIFNNNSQYTAVENSIREDAIPILV